MPKIFGGGWLVLTSSQDNVSFKLFNVSKQGQIDRLILSGKLGKMETGTYWIKTGYYLLQTDKRIQVCIRNGPSNTPPYATVQVMYVSANGTFLGKDFVFYSFVTGKIYVVAFEDANVTLLDDKGNIVQKFSVWQNETVTKSS